MSWCIVCIMRYTCPLARMPVCVVQEVYGLAETPRVAGGARVPVQLELLSPGGRPLQTTSDLASFWRASYKQVRPEVTV